MKKLKTKLISVLHWSEKYTKTDMIYLTKGGFWAILGQIIVSFASFLLAIAFANLLPKEIYGQYKYVLSLVSILGTFTLTGLTTAIMRSVIRGHEGSLNYAFWQNIKWSAVFFVGSLGIATYYILHGNYFLGISMLLAGCLWPIFVSTNLYSPFLSAKKDFKRSAIYFDIIGNLFPYTCIVLTILITKNPLWLVTMYLLSNTVIGMVLYIRVTKIYKPNKEVDPEFLHYSKHLSLMNILNGVASNIDQILVFHFIGPIQLAIYNFAVAIPNQIKGPVKNLSNLIFPKYSERSDLEIRKGMRNKISVMLLTLFVIIVVYILLTPFIFKIFFPKYTDAVFYSQIFSLSLLWAASTPASVYLSAKKKIKEQYIINVLMSIAQIIIVSIAVIFGGLLWLIIARVLIRFLFGIISIKLFRSSAVGV